MTKKSLYLCTLFLGTPISVLLHIFGCPSSIPIFFLRVFSKNDQFCRSKGIVFYPNQDRHNTRLILVNFFLSIKLKKSWAAHFLLSAKSNQTQKFRYLD